MPTRGEICLLKETVTSDTETWERHALNSAVVMPPSAVSHTHQSSTPWIRSSRVTPRRPAHGHVTARPWHRNAWLGESDLTRHTRRFGR